MPFIPYLNYKPVAWTLSVVYAGGGLNSLGGIAIDGDGNAWAGDNFHRRFNLLHFNSNQSHNDG